MKKILKKDCQLTLYINTSSASDIIIGLQAGNGFLLKKKISAPRRQSEKLLLAIDKLLKSRKIGLNNLKEIIVADQGDSFTSLRIGVLTANALAYALHIPIIGESFIKEVGLGVKNRPTNLKSFAGQAIIEPIYSREANIGISKKPKL